MKEKITLEERQEILKDCVQNPDKTVQEVMNMYNVSIDIAYDIIKDSAKELWEIEKSNLPTSN